MIALPDIEEAGRELIATITSAHGASLERYVCALVLHDGFDTCASIANCSTEEHLGILVAAIRAVCNQRALDYQARVAVVEHLAAELGVQTQTQSVRLDG